MRQQDRHPFRAMALMSGIGSSLAGSILIGIFAGRGLDRWLETEPLFLIIGLLLGVAAGVMAVVHLVNRFFSGD